MNYVIYVFILYINDIVNVNKDVELILFADNTNVFLYDTDINQLSTQLTILS